MSSSQSHASRSPSPAPATDIGSSRANMNQTEVENAERVSQVEGREGCWRRLTLNQRITIMERASGANGFCEALIRRWQKALVCQNPRGRRLWTISSPPSWKRGALKVSRRPVLSDSLNLPQHTDTRFPPLKPSKLDVQSRSVVYN